MLQGFSGSLKGKDKTPICGKAKNVKVQQTFNLPAAYGLDCGGKEDADGQENA